MNNKIILLITLGLALISFFALPGCIDSVSTNKPPLLTSPPQFTAASTTDPIISSPEPATQANRVQLTSLGQAKPYLVVERGNLANENTMRTAGLWFITATEAVTFEEYAQTAIQATLDLYCLYRNNFTAVILIPQSGIKTVYSEASYAADGKGAAGMTGSAPAVPMFWRVRAMNDIPYDAQELAILHLWQDKQADFPSREPFNNLSYDEKGLRQYVADTLRIPYSETQVRSLKIVDYSVDVTFLRQSAGPNVLPNIPQSEAMLETLSEPVEFTSAEKAKLDDQVSRLPPDVKPQFNDLYEAAEKVSRDSRWMIYSSCRPYVQSAEYQQLLHFCQEKGQAIWPLLFRKLETESRVFTGGLIVDLTLPAHVYYLERTVDTDQLKQSTSENHIMPAGRSV